jgi:sugar phosphate isomerase/epimerase
MPHTGQLISRRKFLKVSACSISGAMLSSFSPALAPDPTYTISIGLCGPWENSALAKQAGCTYIEEGVAKILMPDKPDLEFNRQYDRLSSTQALPIQSFNVFLPGEMHVVGDNAGHETIVNYASVAFTRMEKVGAKILVFGSGRARMIPEGFDKAKAKEQFITLCKILSPMAEKHNITLAVEQLNRGETNFINTLQEAGEIVDAVNHPNLKMICDIYHVLRENDPASELVRLNDRIVHCHIAEREDRTPPGVRGDDFTPYFRALKKINYTGRISLECRWKNQEAELPVAVKVLKEQYSSA